MVNSVYDRYREVADLIGCTWCYDGTRDGGRRGGRHVITHKEHTSARPLRWRGKSFARAISSAVESIYAGDPPPCGWDALNVKSESEDNNGT